MAESEEIANSHHGNGFLVAGIGASAGGIAPLREFFSRVREDSGIAYVVVLHLSPQHESNLPALIQNKTKTPVIQVTETLKVQPNHVYVIPPSKYLVMVDGTVRLTEPERSRGGHTSIDLFFRTLADAYGTEAVAILLSGTGVDGTIGLGRIKEQGGFVIVQDPAEAEYPDMPRNALDAGLVDLVMPVAEMPAKLLALRDGVRRLKVPEETAEELPPITMEEGSLREVLSLLRMRTGNDFSAYRRPTLLRRIMRRMQVHELHGLSDYQAFLREKPEEISALLRDLLISVTNFFRDNEAFDALAAEVIPQLFAGKKSGDQVRVWSAGCATGEEAYSLAILLTEYAEQLTGGPKIQVFGTDIDDLAILQAREGRYPQTISLDVSPGRVRRFFTDEGDRYQIKKQVREAVLFATHNLLRDPPFSKLDLVSCRNLLIYLNREMQQQVLEVFHFALRPDGYLFLGGSETAESVPSLFTPIDKKRRIYRRRPVVGSSQPTPNLAMGRWRTNVPNPAAATGETPISPGQLHQEVVEQLAPPSVLINEEYDIIHASATVGRYLHVAGGEPTRNILKLVDPALRLDLRSALLEAKARGSTFAASVRRLGAGADGNASSIALTVRPVTSSPDAARGSFLVTFDETSESPVTGSVAEGARLEMVGQLEQELQRTKDQLRITIEQHETSTEELRASNEELQAINEELRSATEELETSKEELQSVNEELTTVNLEYKDKIEEVGRANGDLQNLMGAIDIATIFLDRELQIKRYTPRAREIFNITPGDVGRPLEHFTNKLDYGALHKDAERVTHTLQTVEREVRSTEGQWYLARLSPYRTVEDRIDGVVLTFVDMTNRKRFEDQLERQTVELKEHAEILNLAHVMILDDQRRIVTWNAGCEKLYGYSAVDALGKDAHELLKTVFPVSHAEIDEELQRSGQWQGELVHTTKDGKRLMVASHWILHRRRPGQPPVILEVNSDITDRRIAEDAAREADRNKDLFLATLAHELRNPLGAMLSSIELLHHRERNDRSAVVAEAILKRQLGHLLQMVDDLLDVERLTHGRIELRKARISAGEVIQSATETCQSRIDAAGHRLNVVAPPEPIVIDGDPMRLTQILVNLLDNASKYTASGGTISLTAEKDEREAIFRVRDSGIGIAPDVLPRVFSTYFQGDPSPGAILKGLGLGLALVRQLTEMHGGSVSASSEGLGKGSEFTVRIPLAAARSTEDKAATSSTKKISAAPANSAKLKVMVVDDNRDSAEATLLILQANGHDARSAHDGPAAIELAKSFIPDAAVVDIGLPEMDGYQVARRLRDAVPGIVLIAFSGWRLDSAERRVRDAGFHKAFTKPLDPNKLNRYLAEVKPSAK